MAKSTKRAIKKKALPKKALKKVRGGFIAPADAALKSGKSTPRLGGNDNEWG